LYYTFDSGSFDLISILEAYTKLTGKDWRTEKVFLFLDEIQKLKDWSGQLKMLYDNYTNLKLGISSSASLTLQKEALYNMVG
jgi:predicted AAA+ superfamily ATPase